MLLYAFNNNVLNLSYRNKSYLRNINKMKL